MVGAGVSGSVNLAKSSINSNYQSVGEHSAIRAGDGGFQVEVKGNTTLTGAQITSTQAAIDNNKNSFNTGGTLTTTDLQNSASYEAKSVSWYRMVNCPFGFDSCCGELFVSTTKPLIRVIRASRPAAKAR